MYGASAQHNMLPLLHVIELHIRVCTTYILESTVPRDFV